MSTTTTGKVRLSFPALFEPVEFENDGKPKYSVMLLIPKTDKKTLEKIKAAEEEAIEKGIESKWGGKKPKTIHRLLKDGDEPNDEGETFPEREGHYFMTIRSDKRPIVVDRRAVPMDIENSDEIYSGCYGYVKMNAFPYKFANKSGVTFGLQGVQKVADGEHLGGGVSANDFDALDEDDDLL